MAALLLTAKPTQTKKPFSRLAPIGIFALALLLRVWGMDWALPHSGRWFSFHPDENLVVAYSTFALNPFALRLDPGFYNYGSLGLLLLSAVVHAGDFLGLAGTPPATNVPPAGALLLARLVTVLLGAGTCFFLVGAGRRLYGNAAGLIAGLLYAVAPLAVQHGHFATVDVPATFFVAGALFFAARFLASNSTSARDLFWCGLWAGLAAATKYNAGAVLLAGAAAWGLKRGHFLAGRELSLLLGGALAGFLVGCPGALLNTAALLRDVRFEAGHVRAGHDLVFVNTPPAWEYQAAFNLRWGLGMPLLLVCAGALGVALWRRRPADVLLLAYLVPYYALIGFAQVKFARYTLPLFPPLLLLAGGWLASTDFSRKAVMQTLRGLGGVAAGYALLLSLALDRTMTLPDTRDQAAAFLRQSDAASVGFAVGPWFYAPTLHPALAAFNPQAAKRAAATSTAAPRLVPAEGEWNADQLTAPNAPDAVALSEFEYADALRARDPAALAYLRTLRRLYPNVRVFARPVQFPGLPDFTHLAPADPDFSGLPTQHLPHDMLYTNPTTVVFTR